MQRKKMLGWLASLLAVVLLAAGCATSQGPSKAAYQGAGVGAATGAVAGALLDDDNRWKGGVIGGALGAMLGGALGEISHRDATPPPASQGAYYQPAYSPQPASYRTGSAAPCRTVTEKHYDQDGKLIKVIQREVCD